MIDVYRYLKKNMNSPHMLSASSIFVPWSQHQLHDHQSNWIWICPCCSTKCNSKLSQRNVVINHSNLNYMVMSNYANTQLWTQNMYQKNIIKKDCSPTSEPVNIVGFSAINWDVTVGWADNFVKSFLTCSTTSSCLTAPAADITCSKNSRSMQLLIISLNDQHFRKRIKQKQSCDRCIEHIVLFYSTILWAA